MGSSSGPSPSSLDRTMVDPEASRLELLGACSRGEGAEADLAGRSRFLCPSQTQDIVRSHALEATEASCGRTRGVNCAGDIRRFFVFMSPAIKKCALPVPAPGVACELLCSTFVSSCWRCQFFNFKSPDGVWTLTTPILSQHGDEHTSGKKFMLARSSTLRMSVLCILFSFQSTLMNTTLADISATRLRLQSIRYRSCSYHSCEEMLCSNLYDDAGDDDASSLRGSDDRHAL